MEERLDARQDACLRTGMDAYVVQSGGKQVQIVQSSVEETFVFSVEEMEQFAQIPQMSVLRIGRKRFSNFRYWRYFLIISACLSLFFDFSSGFISFSYLCTAEEP